MDDTDALILRLKEAVYGADVSRAAVETTWAECHKPRCQCTHGRPEDAFLMMKRQISDAIESELRWRVTSRPDVAQEDERPAEHADRREEGRVGKEGERAGRARGE